MSFDFTPASRSVFISGTETLFIRGRILEKISLSPKITRTKTSIRYARKKDREKREREIDSDDGNTQLI